jgi:hypothetical protein
MPLGEPGVAFDVRRFNADLVNATNGDLIGMNAVRDRSE